MARLQAAPKQRPTARHGTACEGGAVRRADIGAGRRRSESGSPRDATKGSARNFRDEARLRVAETVTAVTGRERGRGNGYSCYGAGRPSRPGRKQCSARKCPAKLRRRRRGLDKQEWRSCGGEYCVVLLGLIPPRSLAAEGGLMAASWWVPCSQCRRWPGCPCRTGYRE